MTIASAAGQHSPGDARQFVGDDDHHFVACSSLTQPVYPLSQSRSVVLDAKQRGHRAFIVPNSPEADPLPPHVIQLPDCPSRMRTGTLAMMWFLHRAHRRA